MGCLFVCVYDYRGGERDKTTGVAGGGAAAAAVAGSLANSNKDVYDQMENMKIHFESQMEQLNRDLQVLKAGLPPPTTTTGGATRGAGAGGKGGKGGGAGDRNGGNEAQGKQRGSEGGGAVDRNERNDRADRADRADRGERLDRGGAGGRHDKKGGGGRRDSDSHDVTAAAAAAVAAANVLSGEQGFSAYVNPQTMALSGQNAGLLQQAPGYLQGTGPLAYGK